MAHGSEWGREIRRRRTGLGLSQARVAEAVGVPVLAVGRWERGERTPAPEQLRALAGVLEAGPDEMAVWAESLPSARTLDLEIVEPLAPPLEVVEGGLSADPWSVPPERRIEPPRLDRRALVGGAASSGGPAVIPISGPPGGPVTERDLRRRARAEERGLRRQLKLAHQRDRHRAAAEARASEAAEARAARTAALPVALHQSAAPPPAGAANTGSVFPVPDSRRSSERVTYRGVGEATPPSERLTYAVRILLTVTMLLVLAGLLWWAVGSLGDGFGAVLDLLRGGPGEADGVSRGVFALIVPV
jgi:transcriptional regulator with XRE-family HTH domain